ncbi:MAG: NAD(+) diphosphatase [Christensenellaceae bacterium]
MIHDIAPHRYDNAFLQSAPGEGDAALYYEKDTILLCQEGKGWRIWQVLRPDTGGGRGAQNGPFPFSWAGLLPALSLAAGAAGPGTHPAKGAPAELAPWVGFAGVTGWQLGRWEGQHHYCGACGAPMRASQRECALVCTKCGCREYPRINPAVIVAVRDGEDLLMIRSQLSTTGRYHLLSGYVEVGETLEQTVEREVMEEVGVRIKNIRYYANQPWSFSDTLMIGFTAKLGWAAAAVPFTGRGDLGCEMGRTGGHPRADGSRQYRQRDD